MFIWGSLSLQTTVAKCLHLVSSSSTVTVCWLSPGRDGRRSPMEFDIRISKVYIQNGTDHAGMCFFHETNDPRSLEFGLNRFLKSVRHSLVLLFWPLRNSHFDLESYLIRLERDGKRDEKRDNAWCENCQFFNFIRR